jgi:hypothetical protein
VGDFVVDCGNESESITIESPISISACPDLAAGRLHSHALLRAERGLVELDRVSRVLELRGTA